MEQRREKNSAHRENPCTFYEVKTEKYESVLDNFNIVSVYVPANMTNHFQALDLKVNDVEKTFIKQIFRNWYDIEIKK